MVKALESPALKIGTTLANLSSEETHRFSAKNW